MYTPYNPFEPVDLPLLLEMRQMKKFFLVIQRFSWPGVPSGTGFMITPYKEEEIAKQHAEKLAPNKVCFIDLQVEYEKLLSLINDQRYLFFVNNLSDESWADQMLEHYRKNVISFVTANTNFRGRGIDVKLTFKYGSLKAIIQSNGHNQEFDAYDVFK